ncbi:MAG: hypothetical protein R3199_09170 [Gemmatimonadota bacterium]|nr:hypothetical protein [Gemmatimonadota bacterium]
MRKLLTAFTGVAMMALFATPLAAQEAEEEKPEPDRKFDLVATEDVPDAEGEVWVFDNEMGEDRVVVKVKNLPDPADFGETTTDYTVWIVADRDKLDEARLVGTLDADETGHAKFETTTPLDNFGVLVMGSEEAPETVTGVAVLTGMPANVGPPAVEQAAGEAGQAPAAGADVEEAEERRVGEREAIEAEDQEQAPQ